MTKDEALDLALEALEWDADYDTSVTLQKAAITAIKQARSAPVQEPKFWYDQEEGLLHDHFDDSPFGCIPLYTTPPAAPVQERNFCERCGKRLGSGIHTCTPPAAPTSAEYAMGYAEGFNDGCKPAPVQEPVAFFDWYDNAHWGNEDFKEGCHRSWNAAIKYTTPPAAQRQWVGLTDEEIDKTPCELYAPDQGGMTVEEGLELYARAIEAKLRSKNEY